MKSTNPYLSLAGILCFVFALFQAVISIVPEWSAFFGAGELASDPAMLLVAGLVVTVLSAVAGLYGLSGAGLIRRLPLLRTGLSVMALFSIYRGTLFIPQFLVMTGVQPAPAPVPLQYTLSSLYFLIIGLLCLAGLISGWSIMKSRPTAAA